MDPSTIAEVSKLLIFMEPIYDPFNFVHFCFME